MAEVEAAGTTITFIRIYFDMTKAQAATIISLETVFKSNSIIKSFNEFKYFTKVTTLANPAFEGSMVAQITFPSTIRYRNIATVSRNV